MKFKPIFWLPIGVVALLVAWFLYAALNPHESKPIRTAAGELSNKQERAVTARRDQEIKAADQKRAAADRATKAIEPAIAAGNTAAKQATILRHQSRPKHATPVPNSDSATIRLQRDWSNWP